VPMYIDRHELLGITAEELAAAHYSDLAAQPEYGVHYHTYWFDPESGCVFCLAEGPNQEAVEAVHRSSHGQVATSVIEIEQGAPLRAYFGELPTYPPGTAYEAPGMRVILFTDVCGSVAQTHQLGDDAHVSLLREHNEIVRAELVAYDGREVKHTGDGIMAAFSSVAAAINFAASVQRTLDARNQQAAVPLHVSIGISAGEPVTDDNGDLFGAAVQLAARLCDAASADDIVVSVGVRELCMGKSFRFEDRGVVMLKGVPEPTQTYVVSWRD
jgi:class 3 adenylate cyclase